MHFNVYSALYSSCEARPALGHFKMRPALAPSFAARAERSTTACTASLEPKRKEISKAMDNVPRASIKKKKDQPESHREKSRRCQIIYITI